MPRENAPLLLGGAAASFHAGESGPLPVLMPSWGAGANDSVNPGAATTPLGLLDREGLLNMKKPVPNGLQQFEGLFNQAISSDERKVILDNQQKLWGDDEIRWRLARIIQTYYASNQSLSQEHLRLRAQKIAFVDPLTSHGWLHFGPQLIKMWCQQACPQGMDCVLMVVPLHGHWVPVMMWMSSNCLRVRI